MKRWLTRIGLSAALAVTAGVGVAALVSDAYAKPCLCPDIYAPVICDNGRTYPNQCVANCNRAKNCVPTGIIR